MKVLCCKCFFCCNSPDEEDVFDTLQKIICFFIRFFLSSQLNEFLQSEISLKLSSVQKITCITTTADRKVKSSIYIGSAITQLSLQIKLNSFFRLVFFSLGIRCGIEKKLSRKKIKCKLGSSSVICNLSFQLSRTFETFPENDQFCQKSGTDANIRRSCHLHHYDALHAKIEM